MEARPAERGIELDLGAGRTRVFTNPWRGDQTTAYRSTAIPNIDTYTALPPPVRLIMRSSRRAGRLYASRPWQARLRGPEVNRFTALTAVEWRAACWPGRRRRPQGSRHRPRSTARSSYSSRASS